ncbi:MAG: hypothetical protein JWR19_1317 [Pedosphaera sp.]|nr:hypothetical protein [Pedosphaera sp.]
MRVLPDGSPRNAELSGFTAESRSRGGGRRGNGIDDENEDERGPEGCFRTGIMNDKVKQGILRICPGGCRVLRVDKGSQGGFKDGQGNLRQFKN